MCHRRRRRLRCHHPHYRPRLAHHRSLLSRRLRCRSSTTTMNNAMIGHARVHAIPMSSSSSPARCPVPRRLPQLHHRPLRCPRHLLPRLHHGFHPQPCRRPPPLHHHFHLSHHGRWYRLRRHPLHRCHPSRGHPRHSSLCHRRRRHTHLPRRRSLHCHPRHHHLHRHTQLLRHHPRHPLCHHPRHHPRHHLRPRPRHRPRLPRIRGLHCLLRRFSPRPPPLPAPRQPFLSFRHPLLYRTLL